MPATRSSNFHSKKRYYTSSIIKYFHRIGLTFFALLRVSSGDFESFITSAYSLIIVFRTKLFASSFVFQVAGMDSNLWKSKNVDAWNFQYFEGYPSELNSNYIWITHQVWTLAYLMNSLGLWPEHPPNPKKKIPRLQILKTKYSPNINEKSSLSVCPVHAQVIFHPFPKRVLIN